MFVRSQDHKHLLGKPTGGLIKVFGSIRPEQMTQKIVCLRYAFI